MEDGFRPEADEHDYSPQAIDLAEACGGMQDCPCCYVHLGSASHMANQELPAFGMTSVPPTLEPSKILDIIGTKQTQYYALWAVYTAVQFSAATYGIGKTLSWSVAIAVLAGFWIFNLGHLGFVLQCVRQLDRLQQLLLLSASADPNTYRLEIEKFYRSIGEGTCFWKLQPEIPNSRSYLWNLAVHISIDLCASLALILRAGVPVPG